jgi:hypothetical protein
LGRLDQTGIGLGDLSKVLLLWGLSVFSDRGKGAFDAKSDGFLRAAN